MAIKKSTLFQGVAIFVSIFCFSVSASATEYTVHTPQSCLDLPAPTSWRGVGCEVTGDATILAGDKWIVIGQFFVPVSTSLTVQGVFETLSTVTINGTLNNENEFQSAGVFCGVDCKINNHGTFVADSLRIAGRGAEFSNEFSAFLTVDERLSLGNPHIGGTLLNDGQLINNGDILINGRLVNTGDFSNNGTIEVDCGHFEQSGVFSGPLPTMAFCWWGRGSGGLWSSPENWLRNSESATTSPGAHDKILIRGDASVHLDVDFTLERIISIGEDSTFGVSTFTVDDGVTLTNLGVFAGAGARFVNDGTVENFEFIGGLSFQNNGTTVNFGEIHEGNIDNTGSFLNWSPPALVTSGFENTGSQGVISNLGGWIVPDRSDSFNSGTIENVGGTFHLGSELTNWNNASFVNNGILTIGTTGSLVNEREGLISNLGQLWVTAGAAFKNVGKTKNTGLIDNIETINNTGHLCGSGTVSGSVEPIAPVLVCDTTPPVIVSNVSGTLGNNGWYTSDVTVSWTVTDPGSPLLYLSGCGPSTLTSDITQALFYCSATSFGGYSRSDDIRISRDATPPTFNAVVSPNPVLQGLTAIVTPNAQDARSGLASSSCEPVPTSTLGEQTVQCSAVDVAGNGAWVDATYTVITPAEAAEDLVETVESLGLPNLVSKSLIKLMTTVARYLDDDDEANDAEAQVLLDNFIKHVQKDLNKGRLTHTQAELLIARAEEILSALDG